MSEEARKNRWIKAIRNLETDENFAYMQLVEKLTIHSENQSIKKIVFQLLKNEFRACRSFINYNKISCNLEENINLA